MRGMLLALTLLTLPVQTTSAQPGPSKTNLDQPPVGERFADLHDRWQAALRELNVPGLAVVAVQGDKVVLLDALGVCDPAGKQAVTPRSPFYLASVTKSFTALGVAILVEEGKVKLDEPVKTYLPRFTLADPKLAATITVRDLLCHRYGLNSEPISLAEAYLGNITDERYYMLLAAVEPQEFAYSNLHYTLAGRIIEAVSGQKWQDFLAQRVFAPLGMRDATCYASQLYANPLAAWPIEEQAGKWERAALVKNDAVMHAAGGMGASASDLAHWLVFQLTGKAPDGKQLVSPELLREIHTRQAGSQQPDKGPGGFTRDGYSLGWFTGTFGGRVMREHGGGYLGTATLVSILPDDKLGVAVLVNESRPGVALLVAADVYARLLDKPGEDLLPWVRENVAKMRARAAASPKRVWQAPGAKGGLSQPPARYAGKFANPIWGEAVITEVGDALALRIGTLDFRWHALDDDCFELQIPPGDVTQGQFTLDGQGAVTGFRVITPLGNAEFARAQ
jgi:CubicO group peptidase (beta-lactamase class C family)